MSNSEGFMRYLLGLDIGTSGTKTALFDELGNTIETASNIIKHAHKRGAKTIGTAGIFGFGDENIEVKDISHVL